MDVYKIGISIAMQNGVSAVLGTIMADLMKLNAATMTAAAGFGRLKLAIAGAAGVFAGVSIIKGLSALADHGEKYTHQLEMMKVAGMRVAEMQDAINAANKVSSSVMSTTPAENIKTILELRQALASADVRPDQKADPAAATAEAVAHLETFQKISGIMSSTLSREGKPFDGSGQAFQLAKAAEMLGLTQDPKKFDTVLEGWTKAIIAQGGKLSGSDIFSNVKYLRGAGLGMDIEFLTQVLPSLAAEFKTGTGRSGGGAGQGGGAGNPLASMFSAVVGGTLSNKAVKALEQIDLIDRSKVHLSTTGVVKAVDAGAVRGADVMVHNPYKFVTDFLQPHMEKFTNYLDKNDKNEFKHPAELFGYLAHLMGNRTAQQVMGMMLLQQNRIKGDIGLNQSSLGINPAFGELSRRDPVLVRKQFDTQAERVWDDLGVRVSKVKTEILYQLSNALRVLAETIEAHSTATKIMLGIAAAMGVLLVAVGSLAVIGAAIGAVASSWAGLLIVGTLTALGAAVMWLDSKIDLFNHIKAVFLAFGDPAFWGGIGKSISDQFLAIINTVQTWTTSLVTAIKAGYTVISDGLSNLTHQIVAWFSNLPSRLWASITGATPPATPTGFTDPTNRWGMGPPTGPGVPPSAANNNQPGSSAANPSYNIQLNQPTARDMANGVSDNQARSLSAGPRATTGFDPSMSPSFSYLGVP